LFRNVTEVHSKSTKKCHQSIIVHIITHLYFTGYRFTQVHIGLLQQANATPKNDKITAETKLMTDKYKTIIMIMLYMHRLHIDNALD